MDLPTEAETKLVKSMIIWVSTVRTDGSPHLVPVWYVWYDSKVFLCIDPASVKSRNIARNPKVAFALEEGTHPVICYGEAFLVSLPYPEEIVRQFNSKYAWDILTENQYNQLVEIHPIKWLVW